MRAPWDAMRRWMSIRRHAAALDRALDAALAGLEPGPDEVAAELAAARALQFRANRQRPPDEVPVVLHAALAAGARRPAPRLRPSVWRPAAAIAMLAAALIALTGVRPGSPPQPDQVSLARNLQQVGQQIGVVESQAARGDTADLSAQAEQLRAALLRAEQAAAQFKPGDPAQASLLATLESEIVSLNQLLARLHLKLSPLPPLPGYVPATAGTSPTGSSLATIPSTTTTPSTTGTSQSGAVRAITPLPPAPTGPLPVAPNSTLAFADPQHGWLVVQGQPLRTPDTWSASRILATTDGGRTWNQELSEAPAPLVGVEFVDPAHGWALAGTVGPGTSGGQAVHGAALLRTTDGGATWRQAGEPASPLGRVEFVDPERGFGVTASDQVVRTADGGLTWQPVGSGSSPAPPPVSSLCVAGNGSVVWAATPGLPLGTGQAQVLRSTDGGTDWSKSFQGGSDWGAQQADIGCAALSAWVVFDLSPGAGQQPAVVEHTGDGGIEWSAVLRNPSQAGERVPVSTLSHAGPFSVVDTNTAHFSQACPPCSLPQTSVVTTGDGGISSSSSALPGSGSPPGGMAFVDPDHGFVVTLTPPDAHGPTNGVQVFATSDGGSTWQLAFTSQ